jgi:hypothetical protein
MQEDGLERNNIINATGEAYLFYRLHEVAVHRVAKAAFTKEQRQA